MNWKPPFDWTVARNNEAVITDANGEHIPPDDVVKLLNATRAEALSPDAIFEQCAKLCDSHAAHSGLMTERALTAGDTESAGQWRSMRLAQERLVDAIRSMKTAPETISPQFTKEKP